MIRASTTHVVVWRERRRLAQLLRERMSGPGDVTGAEKKDQIPCLKFRANGRRHFIQPCHVAYGSTARTHRLGERSAVRPRNLLLTRRINFRQEQAIRIL